MSTFRLAEAVPIAGAVRAPAHAERPALAERSTSAGRRVSASRPALAGRPTLAGPFAASAVTPTDGEIRRAVAAVVPDALRARAYDQVTFPLVAQLAHVAPADVGRCFPTKAQLVLSALQPLPRPTPERAAFESSGTEIVTRYLEFWETGDNAVVLRCLCVAAGTDKRLAAAIEARTIADLIAPFAASARTTDACPRARLAVSELLGLAFSRYVLRQEPLASADHETIAAWAGPALDYFLKGELGRTA